MRLRRVGNAVIEFGYVPRPDQATKFPEAATRFRHRDCEQGFVVLTHFSAFGNESQAIKIHVRTTANGDKGFTTAFLALNITLDTGQRQSTRRLHDRTRVLKNILDRRADFIGIDEHHFIDERFGKTKSFLAHLLDSDAIGEQIHMRQFHTTSGF